MKRAMVTAAILGVLGTTAYLAQTPAPATGQKTLAATMNVYVFPTAGQGPDVQSKDEAECYNYAAQSTGTDPFALAKKSEEQKQQTEKAKQDAAKAGSGAAAAGAVKGAAAGALIGEIASDDAGKGAAYGAAAGMIAGRRKKAAAQQQATQQAEQQGKQAQQATAEQLTNFKKAFSVCLEAKKYMVKF
jgi:hypothetical protein